MGRRTRRAERGASSGRPPTAAAGLVEGRRGEDMPHRLLGLLRQAVYGRLAGHGDVNDATRPARHPAVRAVAGIAYFAWRGEGRRLGREGFRRDPLRVAVAVLSVPALTLARWPRLERVSGPVLAFGGT